jgi:hypothetical protein
MIGFVVERVGDSCSGYKRPHLVVARQDCLGRGLQDPHHSTIRVMLEFFSSANYRKQRAAYFGIKAFRKRAKTFSAAGSIFRLLCSGGYGQVFFPTVRRPLLRATSWSCVKLTNTTTTNRFAYCTFPPPPHPKSHAAFRRNRAAALGPVFCRKESAKNNLSRRRRIDTRRTRAIGIGGKLPCCRPTRHNRSHGIDCLRRCHVPSSCTLFP